MKVGWELACDVKAFRRCTERRVVVSYDGSGSLVVVVIVDVSCPVDQWPLLQLGVLCHYRWYIMALLTFNGRSTPAP